MKATIATVLLLLLLAGTFCSALRVTPHPHDTLTFEEFTAVFNKQYATAAEAQRRQAIYESNKKFVAEFNSNKDATFTVGINAMADLTAEEFAQMIKSQKKETSKVFSPAPVGTSDVPASKDWRTSGCTPSVQDQGQCGAVAAVVAVEIVETMECLTHSDKVHLSEQQLVDCVLQGCNGGFIDSCLDYCTSNGLATVQQYPNSGTVGTCKKVPGKVKCAHVYKIQSGNETALTDVIGTVGPAACAIDASRTSFQLYRSGIYSDPSCSSSALDHMLLNVGYGTTGGKDYYILQNSWGSSWGQSGFILLARNAKNMCGIATDAYYVTVV